MSGQGGKLLGGFVVLHVLCCGLPLLIAAGAFTGAGALLDNDVLVIAGLVAVAVAVAVAVWRARHAADCCPADAHEADARALSGQR